MATPPTVLPTGYELAGAVTRRHLRTPTVLAATIPVLVVALLAAAPEPLGRHPSFLPAFLAVVMVCDLLTGLLLNEHYRTGAAPRTLVLSWAYFFSAAMVVVYASTFPGVVWDDGLAGTSASSAAWVWAAWHVGFAGVVCLALAPWPAPLQRLLDDQARRRRLLHLSHLAVVLAAALVVLAVTLGSAWIPVVVDGTSYALMTDRFGPWIAVALGGATLAALVGVRQRRGTVRDGDVIERWALVALVATLGDVAVSLLAMERFTTGWYGARALAVTASVVVLAALLGEVARLHQRVRSTTDLLSTQNAALLEARAVREHLAAVVSHDLRAPISGLRGYLELLDDDALGWERRHHMLDRSQRLARRLTLMTEDLLTVAVEGDGGLPVSPRAIGVREALEEAAAALPDRDVRVTCPPGLQVRADPLRLQQVLDNLLTNADKYGAEPFELRASAAEDRTRLEVGDAGPGVPPVLRAHLFERYTRGQHEEVPGAGLGLSVVRELVDAQGGEVGYDAARRCFVLSLPGPARSPVGDGEPHAHLGPVRAQEA